MFRTVAMPEQGPRAWLRGAVEILLPLVMAALVGSLFFALAPSRGYRFRASSVQPSFQLKGWTGISGTDGLFFHTKKQMSPWVEIVPPKGPFHEIQVWNRGRNRDRAVPLIVEIPDGKGGFREIARKSEAFAETTFTFDPVRATKVRLRIPDKKTWFHLRRVRID